MSPVKSIFILLLGLSVACTPSTTVDPQTAAVPNTTLDSIGQSILDRGKVLGFSVTIDSAGTTIYNGNFGHIDAEKTQAVGKNTRFDIASISKMVGVAVIMQLVEQGQLDLNQTLDELLPSFPEKQLAQKIQLRHMLSHTSGLLDNTQEMDSLFLATGIVPERKDFFTFFPGKDLLYPPETHYQYSNPGFIFMAFIAEQVTQKRWQELINEMINAPTKLDFQLIKHAVDMPETAPIFNYQGDHFEQVPTWVYVLGDGGLTTTSEMLAKFPRLLAKGKVIQPSSFEAMVNPKYLNDSTRTGYGFGTRNGYFLGEKIIGHTGGWKSTYAIMAYFPERDLTFTGLMNTDDAPEDINQIFAQFMSAYLNKPVPDHTTSTKQFAHPEQLVGQYHGYGDEFDNIGTTVDIQLKENKQLYYCIENYCDRLYYLGSNRFWLEQYPFDYIEFQIGESSSAIREYYYGFFQVLRKKVD